MANTSRRQQLREQQALEAKKARQRRLLTIIASVLCLVVVLVAVFWGIGKNKRAQDAKVQSNDGVLTAALQKIPAKDFDTVGVGTASHGPEAIPGGKPQMVDGKPRIFYIGGEFCPYCAMDRLSLVAALSRFGSFNGLADTLSSPNEGAVSNIPTVTFKDVKFTSDSLVFDGVETADRMGNKLQDIPAADEEIFNKLAPNGGIPFIHFGSAYTNSAPFDGRFLAGKSAEEVASALSDPNSETARAVIGGANVMTAQICKETGGQPADVCQAEGVVAAAKAFK
ncbi:hypothetical protein GCM10027030_01010 [Luteococcus sediminum]